MAVDRRKLFALGGLGVLGAGTAAAGPEFDPACADAITIKIGQRWGEWCVLVPDWDMKWRVGSHVPPVKWMPLVEFLRAIDEANCQE